MSRNTLIQLRRGTAAEWAAVDPVLKEGEPGVELDTGVTKIGNGSSVWSALVPTQSAQNQIANWYTSDAWDQFTVHPITDIIGTTDLTVESGGIGMITSLDEDGDDRQFFEFNNFHAANMEVGIEFWIDSAGTQLGLGMRYAQLPNGNSVAVLPWTNITFAANASILPGTWNWTTDGSGTLFNTNQGASALASIEQEIVSAVGDGATVTVQTLQPHFLGFTQGTDTRMNFGPYNDDNFVVTVVDAITFTFSDIEVFDVTTGTWRLFATSLINSVRRGFRARLTDDQVTYKHWFPDYEPVPSWSNPLRTFTYTVPDPLASGDSLPDSGGAGFMVGHLGDSGREVRVADWYAKSLD